ncbi:chromophore lyase CpcT/CpeT [Flavobacterium sp.]|uniref:chromophore lyase CpcT/CpeT n=1 Tax=Flavobacterium sp. TaxID=239 RepID=UPI00286DB4C3|nr:chromophore lyase CpcT/CpeT [Flavobacterium sp.]
MSRIIFSLVVAVLFFSCKTDSTSISIPNSSGPSKTATKTKSEVYNPKYLSQLMSTMQGYYTSEKQSKVDKTYYYITLRMTPIWKSKGSYLYIEQALANKQYKPYRVRIYKLSQKNNSEFLNEIYSIKEEQKWIGKYKTPKSFDALLESDLELKKGCEVVFKRQNDSSFVGKSGRKSCPSELRGAQYATSKINIDKNRMIAWDQGFDKNDKQVWGATKGGYILEKVIITTKPKADTKPIVKPIAKTNTKPVTNSKPVAKTTTKIATKTPQKKVVK